MARTPLSQRDDYELINKEQDIRGWKVQDHSGQVLGRVADVIIDTDKERVTAVVLDNNTEYPVGDIEISDGRILLGAQTAPPDVPVVSAPIPPSVDVKDDLRLQVVEERLRIGKRQVEQGGVRVSTQLSDRPVQTQVQLREEHVDVVRRHADRPATAADLAAMHDRTVDMVERAEVPVIEKQARVVEEVVVKRDIAERSETVRETVRHTDVEVREFKSPPSPGRPL